MTTPPSPLSKLAAIKRRKLDFESNLLNQDDEHQEDLFSKLADDTVLKIFSLLPKIALGRCASVSIRFNRLATHFPLWKRLDLTGKILSGDSLAIVLARKPVYFRLARSYISSLPSTFITVQPQLLYLDLSMAVITQSALATLLKHCTRLVKLSLEHLDVGRKALKALWNCCDLHTLNLTMCYGLDVDALEYILKENFKLKELNLGWVTQNWTGEEIFKIVAALPTRLTHLNLSGFRNSLRDSHVAELIQRVPGLIQLDLSDSTSLTKETVSNITYQRLPAIEHLAFSRCFDIDSRIYLELRYAVTLRKLEIFGIFTEEEKMRLRRVLPPRILFNMLPICTIARPTTGFGKELEGIWGQRVND